MTESVLAKAQKIYGRYNAEQNMLYSLDNEITAVECGGVLVELDPDVAAQVKELLVKNQQAQIAKLWAEFEAL